MNEKRNKERGDEHSFADFNREDKVEVARCLVPIAIDDFLKFDRRKYPTKYRKGYSNYWNKEEFKKIPDDLLKLFGEIYLESINKGFDQIDTGKILYEVGIEGNLPGFIYINIKKNRKISYVLNRSKHIP